MTGSGDWIDVLVLGCRAGKVTALFHDQFSYSVDVEEASADKLVLKFGRWVGSDPHCCPSMEEHQVYVWSKEGQKYVLDRDYSTPMRKAINRALARGCPIRCFRAFTSSIEPM